MDFWSAQVSRNVVFIGIRSQSLTLTLTLANVHTHARPHSHALMYTPTHTHMQSDVDTHQVYFCYTLTHTHTNTFILSLSLSLSCTHNYSHFSKALTHSFNLWCYQFIYAHPLSLHSLSPSLFPLSSLLPFLALSRSFSLVYSKSPDNESLRRLHIERRTPRNL